MQLHLLKDETEQKMILRVNRLNRVESINLVNLVCMENDQNYNPYSIDHLKRNTFHI